MEDESTFRHHDIVPGAQIKMEMWGCWAPLIVACVKGTLEQVRLLTRITLLVISLYTLSNSLPLLQYHCYYR